MVGRLTKDELIPEEFDEKDVMPFVIEKAPFGTECSVYLPVTLVKSRDLESNRPKYSKRIFAEEKDAKKEIRKYKRYLNS